MENQELFNPLLLHKKHREHAHSKKSIRTYLGYAFFGVLIFLTGLYVGYARKPEVDKILFVVNQKNSAKVVDDTVDFNEFWRVWNLINEKFPDSNKISNKERMYGAIAGLTASLKDPYTVFFPPEESKLFNEEVSGSFSGIGVEIGVKDGMLVVIAPLKNSPAEKAGILPGDSILSVDGKMVAEMTLDESIKYIRGEKGTTVLLSLYRKETDTQFDVSVTRDTILIPTIDENMIEGTIYHISLYNFNANAADLFHQALLNAKLKKAKSIIIDLRGNPGGYLDGAVSIASEFLPEGNIVVSEQYGDNSSTVVHRSKGYNTINNEIPIVVLIDQGSASASEILAGALKDHNRATIIGQTSFGKGSVQELIPLKGDTSIKITVAHWLTPNGNIITKKGIEPTIAVSNESGQAKNSKDDQVLKRAISFLVSQK